MTMLKNIALGFALVSFGVYVEALINAWQRKRIKAQPDRRYTWLVVYQDARGFGVFPAYDVSDLDASLSGLDMDGGRVVHVLTRAGRPVTSEEIGSNQIGMF